MRSEDFLKTVFMPARIRISRHGHTHNHNQNAIRVVTPSSYLQSTSDTVRKIWILKIGFGYEQRLFEALWLSYPDYLSYLHPRSYGCSNSIFFQSFRKDLQKGDPCVELFELHVRKLRSSVANNLLSVNSICLIINKCLIYSEKIFLQIKKNKKQGLNYSLGSSQGFALFGVYVSSLVWRHCPVDS
jgi:hypothetical protein